jgi:lipid-A-disaccharide synthase
VPSVLLPNLILGEPAVPEFLQEDATAERLAAALAAITGEGSARLRQLDALSRLDAAMRLDNQEEPSDRAARICLEVLATKRGSQTARR